MSCLEVYFLMSNHMKIFWMLISSLMELRSENTSFSVLFREVAHEISGFVCLTISIVSRKRRWNLHEAFLHSLVVCCLSETAVKGLGERGVRGRAMHREVLPHLLSPDPGKPALTSRCSVLCRSPPPAAPPRSSCTTSWGPITPGFWWKAFTSTHCWSPQCFLEGGCGPDTCWWVGVSDLNPSLFFWGLFRTWKLSRTFGWS